MVVKCQYNSITFTHGETFYCCLIDDIITPENRRLEIAGVHKDGKTNDDVIHIKFENCTVTKIPQELTIIFPNLKNLIICNSKLKKISKNDLLEYKHLEIISMIENDIEFLPGDLFEDFKSLSYINFKSNKLTLIEPNILDRLKTIRFVNFSGNTRYEKFYSIYPVHNSNASLQEVKNELFEKFYSRYDFLQEPKRSELAKQDFKKLQSTSSSGNLTDDFKSYIQNENFKDFKIQIDDQEFLVHKFLLIARSPTLSEILRNNPEAENLNLVDIPVNIFEKILKFLYTDELPSELETNFLHLFAAAGKLKIKKLIDFVAQKLHNQINPENALEILNLSFKCECNELKRKAFAEVKKKYPKVAFKDEWLANSEKLKSIIEMFMKKEAAKREFNEQFNKVMAMN